MSQVLIIKNKGLNTAPNEFSSVPEGSMVVADNCSIDQDNVVEPRRGFSRYIKLAGDTDRVRGFATFQEKTICAYATDKIAYDNNGALVDLPGSHQNVDSKTNIKFALAGSNIYFTTNEGIKRLDAHNGTPSIAGVPSGLDLQLSTSGSSGFLTPNNQTAYRMIWGIRDANGTLFLGAPSGRAVITNTDPITSFDVSITFTIPSEITENHFYQIYRSSLSGGVDIEPSDELSMVFEDSPTLADLSSKTVTFLDSTLDSLRGASLYTNPSQEGIIQANYQPPIAKDVVNYQGSLFFADCKSKHRLRITLLSASKISIGDTIQIGSTVYEAGLLEDIPNGVFEVFSSGTPGQNIGSTAASIVRVINRCAMNSEVYANVISASNDLPGQIMLEERGVGGPGFSVTMSANGDSFNPVLPASGDKIKSSNDDFSNQIFYSKRDLFEAVPLANYLFVGSKNNRILRIKPLKNTLFVFKENEGIYRITGNDTSNYSVELFDSSANLLAPESIAVVNNQLWCLSDQGIVTLTETGVQVVSRPIEDSVLDLFGSVLESVKEKSFGVGYETDRRYILFTPKEDDDEFCTQAFAWNTFTRTFTRWDKNATAGFVSSFDKKLYLGEGATSHILQERKSLTYLDYVDHETDVTVLSVSGKNVFISDPTGVEVGDVFLQDKFSVPILEVTGNILLLPYSIEEITIGAAKILKSFESTIEYSPVTSGNPGTLKQWSEISLLMRGPRFYNAKIGFSTDVSGSFDLVDIHGARNGLWGSFLWGQSHWGIPAPTTPIRVYVPGEKQYGSYLRVRFSVKEGYAPWKLNGVSIAAREIRSFIIAK